VNIRVSRLGRVVGVVLASSTLVPSAAAQAQIYNVPASGVLGFSLHDIAVADLNGDGRPDVTAFADSPAFGTANHINLIGAGNGALNLGSTLGDGLHTDYALGDYGCVVAADFTGDGKSDLVTLRPAPRQITFALNLGGGFFTSPVVVATVTGQPELITSGDFNADGKLDLAVANWNNSVEVLLGQGNGNFVPSDTQFVDQLPNFLVVGDFNGDGKPDIAASSTFASIDVLLGHGDGTFNFQLVNPDGLGFAPALSSGDDDLDGDLDLALPAGGSVFEMQGHGDGLFTETLVGSVTGDNEAIVQGDFDGDGVTDLATASTGGDVNVLIGHGDGKFATLNSFLAGSGVVNHTALCAADFDGDGKLDLVLGSNPPGGGLVSVLLGRWNFGTFGSDAALADSSKPVAAAVGDFDGDGHADIELANSGALTVNSFAGHGDGTFTSLGSHQVGTSPAAIAAGNFNGDSKLDLIVANQGSNNVSVLLGLGNGNFLSQSSFGLGVAPTDLRLGDFNGDTKLDFATANSTNNSVSVFTGHGDGTFSSSYSHSAGTAPVGVAIGDFNGDGKLDFVSVGQGSMTVDVFTGLGTGSFTSAGPIGISPHVPAGVAAGDFNGDGKPDLAVAADSSVLVLIANGGAQLFNPAATSFAVDGGARSVAVSDVNGDGKLDLVTANGSHGTVSVLLGQGNGSFTSGGTYDAGPGLPASVAVGDFDGDGRPDLVAPEGLAGGDTTRAAILLQRAAPAGTWTHLGFALPGYLGKYPILIGSGSLVGGASGTLALTQAIISAPAVLFVSVASAPVPFKGGTLVPVPFALTVPLVTVSGGLTLPFTWPTGIPSGTSFWFQYAISDPSAVHGVALSNAVKAVTP
jgi:hypothetical protein